MPKYRAKSLVIEAWQLKSHSRLPPWLVDAIREGVVSQRGGETPYMTIEAPQGSQRADLDDFIIRDAKGDLYSCKPGVFELTYEAV